MKRKTLKIRYMAMALVGSMALGLLAGCGSNTDSAKETQESDTITIGTVGPLTGALSVYGTTVQKGAELAVEEINAAGGVLGKQIKYIYQDDKGDVQESINAFNRLVSENNIAAFLGAVTTKPSIAISHTAQELKIPMITPTGTGKEITEAGDYVFRTCFLDPDQGNVMADFAKNTLNATKVAVISNNADDYSVGLKEAFVARAQKLGLEVVADESYGADDIDFKSQLTKIKSADPDALFVPDYYQKDILIVTQARSVGLDIPLLGGDGWDGILDVTSENNKTEADNVFFSNHYSEKDNRPVAKAFIEAYTKKYDVAPISFSALSYDGMKLLAAAIEKAGTTDAEAVKDALASLKHEGVTGTISFDEMGDPLKTVDIIQVKDGAYELYGQTEIQR